MSRPPVRRIVDGTLDRLRFRLDTFPRLAYQPLPQLGLAGASRDAGVRSRWESISAMLDEVKPDTGLDIGSQVGFFTLSMAERGMQVTAVEMEPRNYRTLLHTADRLGLDNVGVLVQRTSPDNVVLLPSADVVIFMSVWHHFVRWHGEASARAMLRTIWARTQRTLVFDTGETEMPPRYGLPEMLPDARAWVSALLTEECRGGTLEFLGRHAAHDADGRPCQRNLFAVHRADVPA